MTLVEEYRNIAKLAQDKENAEVVIDAILTHFDVDYDDMDLGIEWLYTTGVIDYKFRSVLYKGEDLDAIVAWFKAKVGVTDEEIAAAEAKENNMLTAACCWLNNIWAWAMLFAAPPIWNWLLLRAPLRLLLS